MKSLKYLLLPAIAGLFFTACNSGSNAPTQAEIDAQVEAKVTAATEQLKADCDARLLQAAQLQADSIMTAMSNKKPGSTTKPKQPSTKPTTSPAPEAPVKTNPKADRFNNNGGTTVNAEDTKKKTDRFDNDGKKTVTEEDTKKKADRFKK